jgi:outer membrane receptor protein involved in Fe transport
VSDVEVPIGSRDIAPLLLSSTLNYDSTRSTFGAVQLNYRGARDAFPSTSTAFGEGPVAEALLVNLLAGIDTRRGRLQFGVENVFNTEYTSIAAGAGNSASLWVPEEGTRVTLSFTPQW